MSKCLPILDPWFGLARRPRCYPHRLSLPWAEGLSPCGHHGHTPQSLPWLPHHLSSLLFTPASHGNECLRYCVWVLTAQRPPGVSWPQLRQVAVRSRDHRQVCGPLTVIPACAAPQEASSHHAGFADSLVLSVIRTGRGKGTSSRRPKDVLSLPFGRLARKAK